MSTEPEPSRGRDPSPPILPIEQAPYRIRREHYRRERRNSILAVIVIVVVAALVAWGIVRLVGR